MSSHAQDHGAHGSGLPLASEFEPPKHAFDGVGHPAHAVPAREDELERELHEAVAAEASAVEDLLRTLIERPTTLGNEESGQAVMREAFRDLGLEPVDVPMDAEALRANPAAAPFDWDVEAKANVVATWGRDGGGRSLILNGHIDVVPPDPIAGWSRPPFSASRDGDWVVGRGAADMKCGLAAIVGAVRGIRRLGLDPQAPVHLESVVEEECTGNGTLATVMSGYTADAAVIAEPFGAAITTSQVGVLWFHVLVRGTAGHAADGAHGANAIERSYDVMRRLRSLEAELNTAPPPPYDAMAHPINLNVGAIRGGEWTSTVPSSCETSYRIALYPGTSVRDMRERIEAVVADSADGGPDTRPEVRYAGLATEGYELDEDHPLVSTLAAAFARGTGEPPELVATTGTTDAVVLGAAGRTPAVCFGPYAEGAHGVDERVWFPSVVRTAQVMASFVRDWCGLSG
jgi:acetylornithine deacetylase